MPLSREEIRATTKGQIPKPANYQYRKRLPQWEPAETQLSRDEFVRQVQPMHDRIVVQLLNEPQASNIILTDHKPLIGGCRKAKVLKTGPGRWIEGEWWKVTQQWVGGCPQDADIRGRTHRWTWIPGYRRPVSVHPGQIVLIGNWVDLELEDIALCAEMDIRSIWQN